MMMTAKMLKGSQGEAKKAKIQIFNHKIGQGHQAVGQTNPVKYRQKAKSTRSPKSQTQRDQ